VDFWWDYLGDFLGKQKKTWGYEWEKKNSSNLTACYDIDGPFNDVRRTYPQNIDIYIYMHTYIYIYLIAMFNYQRDPEGMILPQMDFSCNWKTINTS
jgi:hypothetical protein